MAADMTRVDEIVEHHGRRKERVIAVLLDCQEEFRYLPRELLERVSLRLDVPLNTVLGVATFFRAFSLKPVGRYPIKVCTGTACHVQGAPRLLDALVRELGVGKGEGTTPDGLFNLDTVNCLGCCGLAPVITVGNDVHGKLRQANVPRVIKKYRPKTEVAKDAEDDD